MWHDLWLVLTGRLSSEQVHLLTEERDHWKLISDGWRGRAIEAARERDAQAERLNTIINEAFGNEFSPARKAMSERIEHETLKRLNSEHKARMHAEGKL